MSRLRRGNKKPGNKHNFKALARGAVSRSLLVGLISIILLLGPALAWALEVSIEPATRRATVGEPIDVVVTVDESLTRAPEFEHSDHFKVQYRGQSQQITIINGHVTRTTSHNYALLADQAGKFEIPALIVTDRSGATRRFTSGSVEIGPRAAPSDRVAGVRFSQTLSIQQAFVGQQVVQTLTVETDRNLSNPEFPDDILDGFWAEPFGKPEQRQERDRTIFEMRRALFPLRAGSLNIPPRLFRAATIRRQRARSGVPFGFPGGLFDDLWGGPATVEPLELTAEAKSIEVNLPPAATESLDGWGTQLAPVGDTGIQVTVSSQPVKTGDTIALEVTVTSVGNIRPLSRIPITRTDQYQVYEERPTFRSFDSGDLLVSERKFKISLVPLKPGTLTVPEIELPYFDPVERIYKRARSRSTQISVSGPDLRQSAPALHQAEPQIARPDTATPPSMALPAEPYSWSSLLFIFLGLTLTVALLAWALFLLKRVIQAKTRRAPIRQATSYEELHQALRLALAQRYGLNGPLLSAYYIRSGPDVAGLPAPRREQIASLLAELEAAPLPQEPLEELRKRALTLV